MSVGSFDFVPVILWTDALIFALLGVVLALVWFIRRHPHLRAPWRSVARRPMTVGAALVLVVFVFIGLLDSLHYREKLSDSLPGHPQYSVEVLSAFDALVGRLRTQQEKTYSAPLALRLYAKEFIERDGMTVRDYPRLKYGGAHLKRPMRTHPILPGVFSLAWDRGWRPACFCSVCSPRGRRAVTIRLSAIGWLPGERAISAGLGGRLCWSWDSC